MPAKRTTPNRISSLGFAGGCLAAGLAAFFLASHWLERETDVPATDATRFSSPTRELAPPGPREARGALAPPTTLKVGSEQLSDWQRAHVEQPRRAAATQNAVMRLLRTVNWRQCFDDLPIEQAAAITLRVPIATRGAQLHVGPCELVAATPAHAVPDPALDCVNERFGVELTASLTEDSDRDFFDARRPAMLEEFEGWLDVPLDVAATVPSR